MNKSSLVVTQVLDKVLVDLEEGKTHQNIAGW